MKPSKISEKELKDIFTSEVESAIYFANKEGRETDGELVHQVVGTYQHQFNNPKSPQREYFDYDSVSDAMTLEVYEAILAPNPYDEDVKSFVITSATNVDADGDDAIIIGFKRNGVDGILELIMNDTDMGYVNYIKSGIKFGDQDEVQENQEKWDEICDVKSAFDNFDLLPGIEFTYKQAVEAGASTKEYIDDWNKATKGMFKEITREEYLASKEADAAENDNFDEAIRYRDARERNKLN